MEKICISSDVSSKFILDDFNRYSNIGSFFKKQNFENSLFFQINGENLILLKGVLKENIDDVIAKKEISKTPNVEIEYEGRNFQLNFKDSSDFNLNALISLYNIVIHSINLNGSIFIFDSAQLEVFQSNSVLAFLRFQFGLSFNEIKTGMNKLENPSPTKFKIESLNEALVFLEKHGLVYFDSNQNQYRVTSRGFICW